MVSELAEISTPQTTLFDLSDQEKTDTLFFEKQEWERHGLVAGVDEAGRGCLAGPVVAAAVILPEGLRIEGVTDSKKVSETNRNRLREQIKEEALAWAVGVCSPTEIDTLNILWAAMEAMKRAVENLSLEPKMVLIDGNTRIPGLLFPSRTLIKGDLRSHSIAAASILAKTHRDELMLTFHQTHPEYGWKTNKGYPTASHYRALHQFGPTPQHRKSFKLSKLPVD